MNEESSSQPTVGKGVLSTSFDDTRKRSDVRISWDEQTIAEHDKLRGTRQKIDEPSTPYHYGSESSQGSDCESADGKASSMNSTPQAGSSPADSPHHRASVRGKSARDKRGSILKVMADVSAALPSESALRRERQARWDSGVSEGSGVTEDKEKARKFRAHREAHYNEFRALREWRAKNGPASMLGSDDSDDDAESKSPGRAPGTQEERKRRRPPSSLSSSGVSHLAGSGVGGMDCDDGDGDDEGVAEEKGGGKVVDR